MKALSEVKTMFALDVYAGDYVRVKDVVRVMEEYFLEYGGVIGDIDTIRENFSGAGEFVKVVSRELDVPASRIGFVFEGVGETNWFVSEGVDETYWFDFMSVFDVKQGVADMIELVNLMEDELKYHKHIMTNFTLYEMLHLFK